jgi:hypothetical protein
MSSALPTETRKSIVASGAVGLSCRPDPIATILPPTEAFPTSAKAERERPEIQAAPDDTGPRTEQIEGPSGSARRDFSVWLHSASIEIDAAGG